jgi:hypothetical protein
MQEDDKKYIKTNIMISPIGQSERYFGNYTDTVTNGTDMSIDMRTKHEIETLDPTLYTWSTGSNKRNKKLKVGDIILFTVTYDPDDQHIQVTKVVEVVKKDTKELSKTLWNDEQYTRIFVLEKLSKIEDITVASFLKKYFGYNDKVNVQGNRIISKAVQKARKEKIQELLV